MSRYNPELLPKIRSDRIKQAVQGMPCTLRISSFLSGHKCSDQSTVIPAHVRSFGKGVNTKVSDLHVIAACLHCHDLLDGRDGKWEILLDRYPAAVLQRVINAIYETQNMMLSVGAIIVPDAVPIKGEYPRVLP